MPRTLREVVFVEGVRTPFGKAGDTGMYAQTRADDLVVNCIRELLRRHPQLPPERVEETAHFLAVGIVNILHTVDPDAVLLGGPMNFGGAESPLGRRFLAAIKDDVRRLAFTLLAERTAIEFATLDAYAALLGAAGLARFSLTVV